MTDKNNARYRISGRVVIRKIGEDTLLVPISGTAAGMRVYPLNETAEVVWRCLSDGGAVHQAADALVERFDVSPEEALIDSEECLKMLLDESLIERVA